MPLSDCVPDLWGDPDELAVSLGATDYFEVRAALEEASWILYSLTGYRYSNSCRTYRDLYRRRNVSKFRLHHPSVVSVDTVEIHDLVSGNLTPVDGWVYLRGGMLGLPGGPSALCSPCSSNSDTTLLAVEYTTAPNLPPGGVRAARKLAKELYLANLGKPCSLPDRVTNVTRQGVSWTMLDPMDFLSEKLTGLGSVDQWISAANNRGYVGAIRPSEWLEWVESEVVGCCDPDPDPDPDPAPAPEP